MEPLLLCMIASCLAGNESKNRRKFANILHKSAPFIFVPFFTLTGAGLDLKSLVSSIWVAVILVVVRLSVIALSTYLAGKYVLKQPPKMYKLLWMTLIPQAGTLIGLVNELSSYGDWATPVCSAAVAGLILNNLFGLKLFKRALYQAGEAGGEDSKVKQHRDQSGSVKIFGVNPLALSVGARMCEHGFFVTMIPSKVTSSGRMSKAAQFTKDARAVIGEFLKGEFGVTNPQVQFFVSLQTLDFELMKSEYLSMMDTNEPVPVISFGDVEVAGTELEEKGKYEEFVQKENTFSRFICEDTRVIILGFRDDDMNWICGNFLLSYMSKKKISRSKIKIIALIKEATWAEKFFGVGITPLYSLSAITEVASQIVLSAELHHDFSLSAIHPMETGTKCGLNITDPKLGYTRSIRILHETEDVQSNQTNRLSGFNQLSSLFAMGLAEPTYAEETKEPAVSFNIYDETLKNLTSQRRKSVGTIPPKQEQKPRHRRAGSHNSLNQ
eukprot:TRINITY_DN2945_c0_g2_i1.p1 TRINITY_DN2945_c0_g2~~TRINITY_DN2945_c0_g2_i1.p1  ORF type:complete len:497 (-),score=117.80 TRINITY_DN2945_c0_g2_i1:1756-3246(-)